MADQKTTQLTALTTPVAADLLYIVDDVAGTPTGKKITYENLFAGAGIVGSGRFTASGSAIGNGGTLQLYQFESLDGDADAVDWGHVYSHGGSFDSSDGSPVTYHDHVYIIGLNVAGSQVAIDANKAYLAFQFESKFTNSVIANVGSEWHLEFREPNATTTKRAISAFLPYNRALRGLGSIVYAFDVYQFSDWLDVPHISIDLEDGQTTYLEPHGLVFTANNTPIIVQRNAADNAYLQLPYINASDRLFVQQSIQATGEVLHLYNTSLLFENNYGFNAKTTGGSTLENVIKLLDSNDELTLGGAQAGIVCKLKAGSRFAITNAGNTVWQFYMYESNGFLSLGSDTAPSRFNVAGNVTIGNTYVTGNNAAPTNGLLVEGAVVVGGTTVNANAIMDLQSTTKPFMPPRMTTTQRDAVASPTAGMVIYNSTTAKLNVYTTAWEAVTSA